MQMRPKICSFLENVAVNCVTFSALESADKFLNDQQILGLMQMTFKAKFLNH